MAERLLLHPNLSFSAPPISTGCGHGRLASSRTEAPLLSGKAGWLSPGSRCPVSETLVFGHAWESCTRHGVAQCRRKLLVDGGTRMRSPGAYVVGQYHAGDSHNPFFAARAWELFAPTEQPSTSWAAPALVF